MKNALTLTRGQRRARTYYAAVGVLAIAAAVMAFLGPFQGWLNGCDILMSQEAMDALSADPGQAVASSCANYLDLAGIGAPLLVGLLLASAAWRYRRTDAPSTVLIALAIPAGLAAGAVPAYSVWWLIDYYRLSIGATEIVLIVIAAGMLGLALYAALQTGVSLGRCAHRRASSGDPHGCRSIRRWATRRTVAQRSGRHPATSQSAVRGGREFASRKVGP